MASPVLLVAVNQKSRRLFSLYASVSLLYSLSFFSSLFFDESHWFRPPPATSRFFFPTVRFRQEKEISATHFQFLGDCRAFLATVRHLQLTSLFLSLVTSIFLLIIVINCTKIVIFSFWFPLPATVVVTVGDSATTTPSLVFSATTDAKQWAANNLFLQLVIFSGQWLISMEVCCFLEG